MSPAQIFFPNFSIVISITLNSITCSTNTHIKILVLSITCEEKTEPTRKEAKHTHTHTHTHTCTRTHTHTHMRTHIHTETEKDKKLRQRMSQRALNADATECWTSNNLHLKFSEQQTWLASRHAQRNHATLLTAVFIEHLHTCQPHLGVNLCPEFVNLISLMRARVFWVIFWWQGHFELQQSCVAVEGRSNVMLNMCA